MPEMTQKEKYTEATIHALAGFQIIEEHLKMYIGYYYDAVRVLLKGQLSFQYTREEINEAPLERLTSLFSKINANNDLVKRIRSTLKYRNEIAHGAFAHLYGPPKTDEQFKADTTEFLVVAGKLDVIMKDIFTEVLKITDMLGVSRKGFE
jgi:hypothetical protein